jgi:DNA-binding Xre family transcriptional regulator
MRTLTRETRETLQKIVIEIAKERDRCSLSQRSLAARSKVSYTTIAKVESGINRCYTLPNLIDLCKTLDIKLSDLLKRIDL